MAQKLTVGVRQHRFQGLSSSSLVTVSGVREKAMGTRLLKAGKRETLETKMSFESHGKGLEESRTGITQGWADNDEILEATRKAKLGGNCFYFLPRIKKKTTRGVIFK